MNLNNLTRMSTHADTFCHWFDIEESYFPMGNTYIKKLNQNSSFLRDMYFNKMIKKYEKCEKTNTFDKEAYYMTAYFYLFDENTSRHFEEGCNILIKLWNKTHDLEIGFVFCVLVEASTPKPLPDYAKKYIASYQQYAAEHDYVPVYFLLGVKHYIAGNSEQYKRFLKIALDKLFLPACGFYVLHLDEADQDYDAFNKYLEYGLLNEERQCLTKKAKMLKKEYEQTYSSSTLEQALLYYKKAASLKEITSLNELAFYYSNMFGEKKDFDRDEDPSTALYYALKSNDLCSGDGSFVMYYLHNNCLIPNAQVSRGNLYLGKALLERSPLAHNYCDKENKDKDFLIKLYKDYIGD